MRVLIALATFSTLAIGTGCGSKNQEVSFVENRYDDKKFSSVEEYWTEKDSSFAEILKQWEAAKKEIIERSFTEDRAEFYFGAGHFTKTKMPKEVQESELCKYAKKKDLLKEGYIWKEEECDDKGVYKVDDELNPTKSFAGKGLEALDLFGKSEVRKGSKESIFPTKELFKGLYDKLKMGYEARKIKQIVLCFDEKEISDDDAPSNYTRKRASLMVVDAEDFLYGFYSFNGYDD